MSIGLEAVLAQPRTKSSQCCLPWHLNGQKASRWMQTGAGTGQETEARGRATSKQVGLWASESLFLGNNVSTSCAATCCSCLLWWLEASSQWATFQDWKLRQASWEHAPWPDTYHWEGHFSSVDHLYVPHSLEDQAATQWGAPPPIPLAPQALLIHLLHMASCLSIFNLGWWRWQLGKVLGCHEDTPKCPQETWPPSSPRFTEGCSYLHTWRWCCLYEDKRQWHQELGCSQLVFTSEPLSHQGD